MAFNFKRGETPFDAVAEELAKIGSTGIVDINVQVDLREFYDIAAKFPKAAHKAMLRTLNKVGKSARAQGIKKAREIYNINAARLRKATPETKARGTRQAYAVTVSEPRIGLHNFGGRQGKKALSVAVFKGRRTKIKGFIATMPGGNKGIYMRVNEYKVPRKGRYKGRTTTRAGARSGAAGSDLQRELLFARKGPGAREIWSRKDVQRAFIKQAEARFPIVLEQELTFELNKISTSKVKLLT